MTYIPPLLPFKVQVNHTRYIKLPYSVSHYISVIHRVRSSSAT